jgi:CheY-like chemotaxis protein
MFESQIEIESDLGKGCAFYFTIKFKNKREIEYSSDTTNDIDERVEPISVLLIEDNKINQLVTQKTIMKLNCIVTTVENGLDALDLLNRTSFDLIITDINLPDITGFETTIKIREQKIQTPVFAITAHSYEEINQQAIESGMDAVFVKPFKIGELAAKINAIVRNKNN